ncbi:DUF6325 family protein [Arthrobacter pigmenti]
MPDETALGPVDFIFLEFPGGTSTRPVATELAALLDRGTIRLFDIVAVRRELDGTVTRLDLAGGIPEFDAFAAFAGAQSGLFDISDVEQARDMLETGRVGVMLAFENTWAGAFVTAAHAAGGRVVASERIPAQTLLDTLDSLEVELDR